MSARAKPTPGHRFGGIRYMAQAKCECGWEGAPWCGKGARENAYAEWHIHRDQCGKGQPIDCSCRHGGGVGIPCAACKRNDHAACGRCNVSARQMEAQ